MNDETKMCRDCGQYRPLSDFYRVHNRRLSYCKKCQRVRATEGMEKRRAEMARMGLPTSERVAIYVPGVSESERFISRHERKREREREIEESLQREKREQQPLAGEMSFADIKHNALDPEPVFRDLTNRFLRPQTKVSSWKTA